MPTKTFALLLATVILAGALTVTVASQFEGAIWATVIVTLVAAVVARVIWRKMKPDKWD